jgi:hypothetical protein
LVSEDVALTSAENVTLVVNDTADVSVVVVPLA